MRQWVFVATALAAAIPQAVMALGLGEMRLLSALHEPLRAEIEIISARPEEFDRLQVVVASSEAFTKLGIDRPFFLTQFRFKPMVKANGKSVVEVTTEDPVREPFLNFLVQADWPGGRLSREYTVLVDPPTLQRKQRGAAPVFEAPEISVVPLPTDAGTADVSDAAGAVTVTLASEYGPTQAGDTLWKIAQRVGSGNTGAMMNALLAANPEAFVNGDPDRLRKGKTLRVPDAAGVQALAQAPDSVVNFQASPTGAVNAAQARIPSATQDQLRIVGAVDAATPAAGSPVAGSEDLAKLQRSLALASEDKAVLNKQNTELSAKLADLEDQLGKLQSVLTARNDELARLQQQVATAAPVATVPETAPVKPDTTVAVATPAPTPEVVSTIPEATPVKPDTTVAVATPTPTPEVVSTIPEVAATTAPETAPATKPEPTETLAQATVPSQQPSDGNLLGLPKLAWLGIGALGLAGFVGGLLFLLRRSPSEPSADFTRQPRAKPEEEFEDDNAGADFIEGASEPQKHEDTSFLSDFTPSDIEAIQNEASAVVDPLSEADVYIAYQRYQQVEDLLTLAIKESPGRVELYLKLLEVYTATKNTAGFERTAEDVARIAGKGGAAWERVVVMGKPWLPSYSAILGGTGSPPTGDSEMTLLINTPAPEPAAKPAPAAKAVPEPEPEPDSGLNFDFDLDTWLKEQQAGTQPAPASADEDPNSSGLDFTLTPPETKAKPTATPPASVPPAAAKPTPKTPPEDDDLAALDFGNAEAAPTPMPLVDESELSLPVLDTNSEMDLFDDVGTKLELARAYVEMGDAEGARSLLGEVMSEGSEAQKQEAREMLAQLK